VLVIRLTHLERGMGMGMGLGRLRLGDWMIGGLFKSFSTGGRTIRAFSPEN